MNNVFEWIGRWWLFFMGAMFLAAMLANSGVFELRNAPKIEIGRFMPVVHNGKVLAMDTTDGSTRTVR